ncbi:putative aldose-1-epimerase [Variovorax sp. PBL-H6]|uniref:aldose 1-epimerase n=1 Tax=Variovorax sp. PBL-H6 TaxID=434009 RepID=UPI0013186126|nr:aldose 1-epimerase [Variovorax sp. PBL-H6]VTU16369.1 putative aldose-1-epimerase [Variovorax sp. PBL-H6]
MSANPAHPVVWLRHDRQRLGLVPSLGGSVAAWQIERAEGPFDLWRPWDGATPDLYRTASFPMVPWSNRISGGGFEAAGEFQPVRPNRAGEPYPIHGDGWLQGWQLDGLADDAATMTLQSRRFDDNPYEYEASQHFRLVDGGLDQTLEVRHLGQAPLPYGLGVHPWFMRTAGTRVVAPVQGVWLCGSDPLPTRHTQDLPQDWDLRRGAPAFGSFVDNAYTGWGGHARIEWPEHGLQLSLAMPDFAQDGGAERHYCLMYRPRDGDAFCFEPITQPIDAFHLQGRPGLRTLQSGQTLKMRMQWRVRAL